MHVKVGLNQLKVLILERSFQFNTILHRYFFFRKLLRQPHLPYAYIHWNIGKRTQTSVSFYTFMSFLVSGLVFSILTDDLDCLTKLSALTFHFIWSLLYEIVVWNCGFFFFFDKKLWLTISLHASLRVDI